MQSPLEFFLKIFYCHTVTFDPSQNGCRRNNKIQAFTGLTKNIPYAVENTFLRYAGTCLKFILRNIFLKIFRSQTVIFDLSQTEIRKNENVFVFQGLKKEKLH